MKNILNEKPESCLNGRLLFTTKFVDDIDLKEKKVLNIGCGFGWFELNALDRGVETIVGMEITESDLRTARESVLDNRASFVVGSALKLPFKDNYFDTVVSWEVVEHLPEDKEIEMFQEIKRVLKKDGVFYLSTPNKSFVSNIFDPAWYFGHRHYSVDSLINFANNTGFTAVKTEIRGSFWSIFSSLDMYISKWIFRREKLFKNFISEKENIEFDDGKGFNNIFIKFLSNNKKISGELTKIYLGRAVDKRMINIIDNHFDNEGTILDLACGSGLYGKYLKMKCKKLFGFDYDSELCDTATKTRFYDEVVCDNVMELNEHFFSIDSIFCSEFLEHVSNDDFGIIIKKIENITSNKIVFTVPNPLSPHFKRDSSHIFRYSIYSLLKNLNKSKKFSYTLHPLGFSQLNLEKWYFRLINPISLIFPLFSPTVLYVGVLKN